MKTSSPPGTLRAGTTGETAAALPRSGRGAQIRQTLLADLFPTAPGPRRIRAWHILGVAAGWVALAATSLVRQTGPGALDTIWAEDGAIFLSRALETSLLHAVAEPYAGYLHVVPRLGAELVTLLPLTRAASALALLGAGITAAAAVLVYVASAGHLRSVPLRALLAGLVVLHPILLPESLNSLALLQWPLTYAAFWLALWRPARAPAALLASMVLFLTALSAPLAIILTPILLIRAVVLHRWLDRIPAALFLAGMGLQVWAILTQWAAVPLPSGNPGQLLEAYRILVATPALFGFALATRLGDLTPEASRDTVGVVAGVLWLVVVLAALRWRSPHRLTAVLAAGASLAIFAFGVSGRGIAPIILASHDGGGGLAGTRYAVVPVLLLITVLALATDRGPASVPAPVWQHVQLSVLGFLLLIAGMDFLPSNDRSAGPSWITEIVEGVHACRGGAQQVVLETSPAGMGWQLQVPCARLPP